MSQLVNNKSVILHTVVNLKEASHLFIMRIHCKSVFFSVSVNLHYIQWADTHSWIPFNWFYRVFWGTLYSCTVFHTKIIWLDLTAWIVNSSLPSCPELFGIESAHANLNHAVWWAKSRSNYTTSHAESNSATSNSAAAVAQQPSCRKVLVLSHQQTRDESLLGGGLCARAKQLERQLETTATATSISHHSHNLINLIR